ncbi:hypothetical protein MAPG_10659 [Magnaporthiopsis poae ATCC 64411]|uniref:Uncharacterized protein n=1 Tax=Magnaporthiopsis poae (strain ATCC 64411 / 73-15) TaxID=644358 RepID=A0A0C4ED66_MAGP6|nr:hypothetical protein MAPG_10659 [Magnaporthiopsis poae ATCC 64411]
MDPNPGPHRRMSIAVVPEVRRGTKRANDAGDDSSPESDRERQSPRHDAHGTKDIGDAGDGSLSTASSGSHIRLMADDCRNLFRETPRHIGDDDHTMAALKRFMEESSDRFEAWAAFLGVFGSGAASLDHRLRRHAALQDMVMRLLRILRQSIFTVNTMAKRGINPQPSASSESSSHKPGNPSLPPSVKIHCLGVQESITKLNKLGINIRASSRTPVNARARAFAASHKVDLDGYEYLAYLALRSLYPNSPESLRQQLADAMTDRYARLQYEAYRLGKPLAQQASKSTDMEVVSDAGAKVPALDPDAGLSASPKREPASDPRSPVPRPAQEHTPTPDMAPSSIDTMMLRAILKNQNAPQSRRTETVRATRLNEPPPPMMAEGSRTCTWCFQNTDRSWVRENENGSVAWTSEGRRHYRNDLRPYVCLAESCSTLRPAFASETEWHCHMRSAHSEFWPHKIHQKPVWTCQGPHENGSLYTFPTKRELTDHIAMHHVHSAMLQTRSEPSSPSPNQHDDTAKAGCSVPGQASEKIAGKPAPGTAEAGKAAQQLLSQLAEEYSAKTQRPASVCPLCMLDLEKEKSREVQGAEASSPQRESTSALPKDGAPAPPELWRHIADHLHVLMVLSLQLMTAAAGGEDGNASTSLSAPSSNRVSEGPAGAGVKDNRFSDLSSDLQGSLRWESSPEGSPAPSEITSPVDLPDGTVVNWMDYGLPTPSNLDVDANPAIEHMRMVAKPAQLPRDCLRSLDFPLRFIRSDDTYFAVTVTEARKRLLEHDKYRSWAVCDRGLLYITGRPGSGKSILLKCALDNRGRTPGARDSDLILSFFFYGHGDELQRSPFGLFRSLLHQVLSQAPDALPDLVDTFETKCQQIGKPGEKWQWHQTELWPFLESSFPRVLKTRSIWLFVDGLEECDERDAVYLIDQFKSLLQSIPPIGLQFRICFTCLHYPLIGDQNGVFEICTDPENREDIPEAVGRPHGTLVLVPDTHENLPEAHSPEDIIRTPLMMHQKQALTFLLRRESGWDFSRQSADFWDLTHMGNATFFNRISQSFHTDEPPKFRGGILADPTGLGKTLTMIALTATDYSEMFRSTSIDPKLGRLPTLIIVPLPLLDIWQEHLSEHVKPGAMTWCLHYGDQKLTSIEEAARYHIILSTYDTVTLDWAAQKSFLFSALWSRIILDEAHMIRNAEYRASQAVCSLKAISRWAVTGTPAQNGTGDLESLLKFIRAHPYDDATRFEWDIGWLWKSGNVEKAAKKLRALTGGLVLRRPKTVIELPNRTDLKLPVEFSPEERKLYDELKAQTLSWIKRAYDDGPVSAFYITVLQRVDALRVVCNLGVNYTSRHSLAGGDEVAEGAAVGDWASVAQLAFDRHREMYPVACAFCGASCSLTTAAFDGGDDPSATGPFYARCFCFVCADCARHAATRDQPVTCWHGPEHDMAPVSLGWRTLEDGFGPAGRGLGSSDRCQLSSKITALISQLLSLPVEKKSVVFSTWTMTLDLVQVGLEKAGIRYERIDGKVPQRQRHAVIERFRNDPGVEVLLLTLSCDAAGLTLTEASIAFLMEPLWDPAVEEQALATIHRLGQKSEVTTVRFFVKDTIEERLLDLQQSKKEKLEGLLIRLQAEAGSYDSLSSLEDLRRLIF